MTWRWRTSGCRDSCGTWPGPTPSSRTSWLIGCKVRNEMLTGLKNRRRWSETWKDSCRLKLIRMRERPWRRKVRRTMSSSSNKEKCITLRKADMTRISRSWSGRTSKRRIRFWKVKSVGWRQLWRTLDRCSRRKEMAYARSWRRRRIRYCCRIRVEATIWSFRRRMPNSSKTKSKSWKQRFPSKRRK